MMDPEKSPINKKFENPPENQGVPLKVDMDELVTHMQVFVLASLIFIILCFYFKLFWLIFLAGFVLTIKYWKHRQRGDGKNGLCFFGVLVALTGIIGMIVHYHWRILDPSQGGLSGRM